MSNKVLVTYASRTGTTVGVAETIGDRALLEEIWADNPLLRHYLGSLDNPELLVYRIVPEQVRFMREWALEYHDVPLDSSRA